MGSFKELNLIVKGDVDGSIEALSDSLIKLSIESVQVNVIHKAVGQIAESDVLLASASDAIIVGFQVRPSSGARTLAEREGVEIKSYSIIYEAIDEIKSAIEGMLEPTKEEKVVEQKVVEPKVEPKAEPKVEQKNNVVKKEKNTLEATFLNQVVKYAETSGEQLDQKTKSLAVDIITFSNKKLKENAVSWKDVDIAGCGFVSQIKRFAKLGLSMEDKLYIDIRNNNKTGLKDICIKPQYQALEKLMVKYFTKPILRFKEDIICVGDKVVEEEDFATGLNKIVRHDRNNEIDRNNLENIIGAYKIAYVLENNSIVQYVVRIDKNRIMRAYKASPSREKTVWHNDTVKMVKKTCTWEMWNDKNIRAFMVFPEEIIKDLGILEESQEMEWNAETKYNNVEQAKENIEENVANGEEVSMDYETGEVVEEC